MERETVFIFTPVVPLVRKRALIRENVVKHSHHAAKILCSVSPVISLVELAIINRKSQSYRARMASAVVEIQRFRVNRNAWKSNLTREIIALEDNLDELFHIVGLKPHRIVTTENSEIDESTIVSNNKRLRDNEPSTKKQRTSSYETTIDAHFEEITKATCNICALITSVTEFDLPIPIQILLRLASRLSSLKWADYKKKFVGSLSRQYVYKNCPILLKASLKLFKWISIILGTNSIPFQPYINQNLLNILEWTRTSSLRHHDESHLLVIRSQVMCILSSMLECLSTNLSLEPRQLANLLNVEILDALENESSVETLECLERLFIVYADFLEPLQEHSIKRAIIETLLRVYRDFNRNVIGLAIRQQLIRILETLANRPHASSTTEIAWHIFELAKRYESDAEIKFIAQRSIKVGLAHRPTIVSNYGVYSAYARISESKQTNGVGEPTSGRLEEQADDHVEGLPVVEELEERANEVDKAPVIVAERQANDIEETAVSESVEKQVNDDAQVLPLDGSDKQAEGIVEVSLGKPEQGEENGQQHQQKKMKKQEDNIEEKQEERLEEQNDDAEEPPVARPEDDPQVQTYLSLFVDKPASLLVENKLS